MFGEEEEGFSFIPSLKGCNSLLKIGVYVSLLLALMEWAGGTSVGIFSSPVMISHTSIILNMALTFVFYPM